MSGSHGLKYFFPISRSTSAGFRNWYKMSRWSLSGRIPILEAEDEICLSKYQMNNFFKNSKLNILAKQNFTQRKKERKKQL